MRGLEATTEIARAIGAETHLGRVLELIVKRGRALVEARGMVILLSDGDDLVITAVAGQVASELIGTRIPVADSAGGAVLRSRRPERISDSSSRLRFALAEMSDAKAGLLVPLVFHGRVMGVLEAFDSLGDTLEFSAEDERIMEAFAASAATAVATAQDVAEQTLLRSIDASDRERARWARELHDETLQELSALKITLSGAKRAADADALREGVGTAVELASTRSAACARSSATSARLRSTRSARRPPSRPSSSAFAPAPISKSSSASTCRTSPAARRPDTCRRSRPRSTALPRKRSRTPSSTREATRVIVALVERGDVLTLSVEDDGRGFDLDGVPKAGFGLIGIRERVELLGGSLTITSSPGAGTRSTRSFPVRDAPPRPTTASQRNATPARTPRGRA